MTKHIEDFQSSMIDDNMLSLSDITSILLDGKKWVIGSVLVFLIGACLYLFSVKPLYRVSAELKIDSSIEQLIYSILDVREVQRSSIESYVEDLKSIRFLEEVFKKEEYALTTLDIGYVVENISVRQKSGGSGIIEISLSYFDPVVSVGFLNAINDLFIKQKIGEIYNSLNFVEKIYGKLTEDISVKEAVFSELNRRSESGVVVLKKPIDVAVFDDLKMLVMNAVVVYKVPKVDVESIKPKYGLVISLAILLGGILGVVVVFMKECMRKGFRSADEVERKIGVSVVSVIPPVKYRSISNNGNKIDKRLEEIRKLRSNILFKNPLMKNNRVMLCAPLSGSGKEDVISQLAVLCAKAEKKTLLIDADIRGGKLHEKFNIKNSLGLANCLTNDDVSPAISVSENLDLVSGGDYPDNPSELLMSNAFCLLLKNASEKYDIVLVNTPPILEVTDAAIVGNQCASSLMVMKVDKISVKQVDESRDQLKRAGVDVSGFILNG